MTDPLQSPELDAYLTQLAGHDHPILEEMEAFAQQEGFPIVGPIVGRVLYQLVVMRRPSRIFELGSGFGYSALWFALGARDAGLDSCGIVLTDGSEERVAQAEDYLGRAGVLGRCEIRCGDAISLLKEDPASVDLFFCDIDKHGYPDALDPMMEKLEPGGAIAVDNMLWSDRAVAAHRIASDGELDVDFDRALGAEAGSDLDASTRGVVELTRRLVSHPELVTSVLPLRDGVTLSVRVGNRTL